MPRAYITLARNDLDENHLQLLDLVPNTSLRNFPYTPPGQTGYLSLLVQNDAITLVDTGAGVWAPTTTVYGLSAYLMDNVENTSGGNESLTAAEAGNIAADILVRVAAGTSLELANINADIVSELGAGNDLEGTAGASTGSVEAVLQIISGAVYRLTALVPISGAANAFLAAAVGVFTTFPNQIRAFDTGAGGRKSTGTTTVVQSGPISQAEVDPDRLMNADVVLDTPATADLTHREIRTIVDTPDLHRSVLLGAGSQLTNTAYTFENPSFTYGAGGTATTVDGTAIGTDFQGRAVVVYKATGEVI